MAGSGSIGFDNIISAVLTIFQMMTLEGWADMCYSIQDSVGMAHWVYFLVLILLGPYLSVQLFLVVLSAKCSDWAEQSSMVEHAASKNKQEKQRGPKRKQRVSVEGQEGRSFTKRWGMAARRLAESEALSNLVLFFILSNTVCMALEGLCYFERDEYCPSMRAVMECLNIVFSAVFTTELCIKIVGLGPGRFFLDAANVLDVVIVVARSVDIVQNIL